MITEQRIGRFDIREEIGRGGMGIVYRAYDAVLDRPVALKLLAPHLGGDERALARFRREAALVSGLKHANIALVYDFGEHEGRPYIALEWVEGRTLKALLADGRLPVERSLRIFGQLASALDYAHARGVVHRDLKPANILIDDEDQVTIVDFGLAWLEDAPSLTMTGTVIGTPLYMSPEQIQGESVDARSDLYSAAIILYEMLSGSTPFGEAATPVVIQRQLFVPPPPISELNPALPAHVEAALTRALAKQADDRFASASAFLGAMQEPGPVGRVQRNGRGRRRWLGPALAVMLVVLAGWWGFRNQEVIAEWFSSESALNVPTREPHWTYWTELYGSPYQSRYLDAQFYPLDPDPRWEFHVEDGISTPLVAGDSHIFFAEGSRIHALNWTSGEPAWEPPQLGADVIAPMAIFGDDENMYLLVATEGDQIYALNGYDAGLVWRIGNEALDGPLLGGLTVGPDGRLYAAGERGPMYGIDVYDSEVVLRLDLGEEQAFLHPPTASPGVVFLASSEADLFAVDLASGDVAWRQELEAPPTTPVVYGEAWGSVLVGVEGGVLQARSALSGAAVWQAFLGEHIVGVTADWGRVYAATADGRVQAFWGDSGDIVWEQRLAGEAISPVFSNGETLVVATEDGRVVALQAENGELAEDGERAFELPLHQPPVPVGGWFYLPTEHSIFAFGP